MQSCSTMPQQGAWFQWLSAIRWVCAFLHVWLTAGRGHSHGPRLGGLHGGGAAKSCSSRLVEQVTACRNHDIFPVAKYILARAESLPTLFGVIMKSRSCPRTSPHVERVGLKTLVSKQMTSKKVSAKSHAKQRICHDQLW